MPEYLNDQGNPISEQPREGGARPTYLDDQGNPLIEDDVAGAAALSKITGISPLPSYQKDIPLWGDTRLPFSVEGVAEALPAGVATLAALLTTRSPTVAGVVGGAAGEAGRQVLRRVVGAPAATGVTQRALGLDPDSPEAAVAGVAGEATAGVAGGMAERFFRGARNFLRKSELRSLMNILQPSKARDVAKWRQLGNRMVKEGVAPAGSSRTTQLARAERALGESSADRASIEAGLKGSEVPVDDVVNRVVGEIPEMLPSGAPSRVGAVPRRAAERSASDVLDVIEATSPRGTTVPFEVAQKEKRRLDKLLERLYEGGRENVPATLRPTKVAADAWRHTISEAFPDLGTANLRESELLTITRLLKGALEKAEFQGGLGVASQEAAAFGAGSVGRMSVPAMVAAKAGVTSGPFASLSAAAKRTMNKLLAAPQHTSQAWVRVADFFNKDEEAVGGERDVGDTATLEERYQRALAIRQMRSIR